MKIRNATERDIIDIAALSTRYTNEVPTWGQMELTEDQIKQMDRRLIWVVEEENRLVGYAIWLPHENDGSCIYNEDDKILELNEIFLIPEARGKGIGSQLLQKINSYAIKAGYTKLLVHSGVKDLDPVMKFYRGNGFKTWGVQMFKEVGQETPDNPEAVMPSTTIKLLDAADIPRIMSAFLGFEWHTPESHFQAMLAAKERGELVFLVAYHGGKIAGFLYIKWKSEYPPFAEKGIPEIKDLRVLAELRRRGIATALMGEAEKRIFERSPVAGVAVGLYADYGAAQRMYIRRGYVPDGRGLMYKDKPVKPGHDVFVDDDLLLYFTKERKV